MSKVLKTRNQLVNENAFLRKAFKNAYTVASQQSDNAAELARVLWCAAQANGGELSVPKNLFPSMPKGAALRERLNEEAEARVFIAHVEETLDEPATDATLTATLPTPMGELEIKA